MAGKLSFSIAINLLTENFKKGTNTVKNGFRSMQAQILTFAAALGLAGVSLSNLISDIIRVARETSKANTALKNVSGSTAQYASNLRFASSLSKKYGVYVNDITSSFAKFTAAANISGMAMEDQRKLFESLSRAATGFGLSSDETRGMFLAVTQMMGKGKIQAEELRGQLGERLPIAMQAMAKAAGTTVAGLDDIMKKGQLLSAEVLPKFADALNEMLPSVNTDNIETSLNRLRNAFQEIVDSSGVQGAYKGLIDALTGLLQGFKDRIKDIFVGLAAVIVFALTKSTTKLVSSLQTAQAGILKNQEKTQAQALLATERKQLAEANLERARANYIKATDAEILTAKVELKKAEIALKAATTREIKALAAQEAAAAKAAAIQSTGAFASFRNFVTAAAGKIAATLKMMWASFGPAIILTILTAIIGKLVEMHTEAKRVRNIFSDYKKEVMSAGNSNTEIIRMQSLVRIMNDRTKYQKEINAAQKELQAMLGVENKSQGELNKLVAERIRLLKEAAKADLYARKIAETEDKINTIYGKYGGESAFNKKYIEDSRDYTNAIFWLGPPPQVVQDLEEIINLKKVLADANANLDKSVLNANTNPIGAPTPPDPDKKEKSPLEKEEEKYAQAVQELTNKLNNRAISEEEYKKKLNDLNKATYDTLSGMLTPEEAAKSKTYQTVKNFSVSSEFREAEANYKAEIGKYSNLLKNGAISEEEYQKARLDLLQSTIKAIASLDSLSEAEKEQLNAMLNESQQLQSSLVKRPELEAYDTTFDYKKSETEILEGQLSVAEANLEKIKAAYNEGAKELISELNEAIGEVDTLGDALKIAEVKKDVKDLTRQLNEGVYSGVKEIASGSGRLVSAFSELRDVFDDEDASAWERIMAVWNTMINTVDAFMSIIKTIESLTEITQKLAKAKEAEAAIDTKTTATKVTNATKEATAEVTSAGTAIVADETAAAVKKQTAIQNVSASTAEGAADAGKSAAKLPFPLNIVAIGGAIAAALAAFAAIPKFAGGGIVQGSSTGDRNLARVNGGEMILNGRQQATLFQLANGKGIKTNGTVVSGELRAQGTELIAVIKNTERKTGRGR